MTILEVLTMLRPRSEAISLSVALAAFAAALAVSVNGFAQDEVPARGFISSEPATTWEEGLICGNGTIGANMFSRPLDETVIFTHERLYLPARVPMMPPLLAPRLFEVRRLIDRGLYHQANQLVFDISDQEGFMYPDAFVPAFDLRLKMDGSGEVSNYLRSVNFETGEVRVRWSDSRGEFERRLFVSRADGLAVMEVIGSKPGSVGFELTLHTREPSDKLDSKSRRKSQAVFEENVVDVQVAAQGSAVTFRNSFKNAYPGSIHALEGLAEVVAQGGEVEAEGETLRVSGADSALVFVDLVPVYDPKESFVPAMRELIGKLPRDYVALRDRHAKLHGELFNRMRLDIGGGEEDHRRTTEELLASTSMEKLNKALIEKEFDAGRYNIICSTGELPPNLQGVWAGTYAGSWASDFTQNGNVPSAIASMLMGNTPELMRAYTSYIESLVPYLQVNARYIFGARGVVLPSRTSTDGFNNAFAPYFAGAFWVGGAPWSAHFFYDYYLHTGDKKFLAETALPYMEKCALFFEDYLYEGPDGYYVFSPTQSPENTPSNTDSQATFNATMSVAATKELLRNCIAASRELGVNQGKISVWEAMLKKMPPYMIDPKTGTVKEWLTPKLDDQLNHRHSSQLYPLFDGMPEEIAKSPKLQEGFKRIIEIKLQRHWSNNARGFMSFGLVQLGQAATSLGESEMAYECLRHLVNRYWLNNLASMHNHKSLFNMDISGGMPAVIIKMLVASEPGRIDLLPAVPKQWPTGRIEGVLCRGQVEVQRLQWSPEGVEVQLKSAKQQRLAVKLPWAIKSLGVSRSSVQSNPTTSGQTVTLTLPANEPVALRITSAK